MGQGPDVSLLDARRDEQGPGDGARAGAPEAAGTGAGEVGPEGRDERRDRWIFRAALVLAALPFVVTAVALLVGVGNSYLPAGDLAMTELHIRDIGRHEVLTGLWSRYDWKHPGPLQFYLVAPFYWLSGGSSLGMVMGALAINLGSVLSCLAIARRRGGTPLVVATLVAFLLVVRTLGPEFLGDDWNLTITVLPYALLAFLTWSMLAGEMWALPAAAFVASFLVQTHIGFTSTAVPLLALGSAALAVRAWRSPGPPEERRRRRLGWWSLGAAGVLALVWLPPVLDMVMHTPDNLTNAYRYFRDPGEPGHAVSVGWRVATGQFGVEGEWLTGKLPRNPFSGESPYLYDAPLPVLLLVVGAALAAVWRWARQGWGLVVTFGAVLTTVIVSIIRTTGPVADYRLRYTWVPPVLAAVAVLWALWLAAARRWPRAERVLLPGMLAAGVALAAVTSVSGARAGTPHEDDVEVVRELTEPLVDRFAGVDDPVLVNDVVGVAGPWYSRAVVLQLERHGIEAKVPAGLRHPYTASRVYDGSEPLAARLVVAVESQIPELAAMPGVELLSRWTTVRADEYEALRAEREQLIADHEAGLSGLTDEELATRLGEIVDAMNGDDPIVTAYDVAVFLDQRPAG
jgi:hypothetical protein